MRNIRRFVAAPAAAITLLTVPVASASAAPAPGSTFTKITGGSTTVVVAPTIAGALLGASILPLPVSPGVEYPVLSPGLTLAASFPVSGGSVNLKTLHGSISHKGGLDYIDFATHKSVTAESFRIQLGATPELFAYIPALKATAPIFDLGLSAAKVSVKGHDVWVSNIAVTLTSAAASALDGALSTKLFTPGLGIGTAQTELVAG